ncbi:hypothetical protein AOQ84DRAFT_370852 [Glonium stellatum]|uniref:Uncharacterized protein n=1 Tax=Glonium stellatum TaxID=574774 RepID=A0A8E2FE00_9PEZI|nr:hypothetical protein AOQ84DRAFT_370852 [Glonium stellatum]
MCKITTYQWRCGTPLDDGIDKCANAKADGRDPYRCPNLEEDEKTKNGCCGLCNPLVTPSASASDDDDDDDDDDEIEDEEVDEGWTCR